MKNIKLFFSLLIVVVVVACVVYFLSYRVRLGEQVPIEKEYTTHATTTAYDDSIYKHDFITIKNKTWDALVSDTESLRETGLSYRTGLKDGQAMLFVFDKPDRYGFWMKDMNFPLDIVWFDKNLTIVSIEKNVSPSSYPKVFFPPVPAFYVAEFPAGTTQSIGIGVGDIAAISH